MDIRNTFQLISSVYLVQRIFIMELYIEIDKNYGLDFIYIDQMGRISHHLS